MKTFQTFMNQKNGGICDIYGIDPQKIYDFLFPLLEPYTILYIDTAHTLTRSENVVYASLDEYDEIINLIKNIDTVDAVIVDNLYNVKNKPVRTGYALYRFQMAALENNLNLIFLNQVRAKRDDDPGTGIYREVFERAFKKYAALRIEVAADEIAIRTRRSRKQTLWY